MSLPAALRARSEEGMGRGNPIHPTVAARHARSAFSLVEVLIVLAIIGTAAAVVTPRFTGALATYRADAAARRVAADLGAARARARAASESRSVTFAFNAAHSQMIVSGESDFDRPGLAYIVDLKAPPYRSRIRSADLGPDNAVVFNGFGLPDSGGDVVVQCGRVMRRITIDALTGDVAVESATAEDEPEVIVQ